MDLFAKASLYFTQKQFFVLYKLPNSNTLNCYVQKETVEEFNGQNGFVFSDFNQSKSIVFTDVNASFETHKLVDYTFENSSYTLESSALEKQSFEQLVKDAIHVIENSKTSKIVTSRIIKGALEIEKEATFKNILNKYPTAFCYWLYAPEVGEWMGASPEVLLTTIETQLETVALAGTQLWDTKKEWQPKELEEQQLVTDYIFSTLKSVSNQILVSPVETVQAGKLAHLKSSFKAELSLGKSAFDLLKKIHPTPAVCGLPKESAMQFINQNEGYKREFYTGFIGEYSEKNSQLFVNLRCMQIVENKPLLYVGCGITAESNPQLEFLETENKAQTMREILVPLP